MKNLLLIIFFGLLLNVQTIQSQNDHLEPAESIFDEGKVIGDYYALVKKVLLNGMSDFPKIRFLIIPSFSTEEVLAIEEKNNEYFIVYHKAENSIWYTETDKEKINIIKKKVEISKTNAELILELFRVAVRKTKYPDESIFGADGVTYYFTAEDIGLKTGKTWSPKKGSKMNKLVKIGNSLIDLTKSSENGKAIKFQTELTDEIKTLMTELK